MASQSPSNLDEEILVCCICLKTLNEPKILSCLHRFCRKCLAEVIDQASDTGKFKCPTCREEYGIPDGGIEGIKGDFLLKAVLEKRKLENNFKERKKEQICSSCENLTTVVAICPDCGGFVCEVCFSGHRVMKTFSSHQLIVTLKDIESGKVNFNFKSMTTTLKAPKCPVHKDMILHINCQTCDKLICPVCAPIHHNNHQLEEIASASERIKGRVQELVENSMISGRNLEMRMEKVRKTSETKLNKILGTSKQLKKTADHEEKNLRRAEQESLKQLAEMKRMIKKETADNINIIREREACLEKEVKMLEKFCVQTLKKTEDIAEEKMKKLRNTQTTAKLLTKDVDNWSVLLAGPDLQHNLQVASKDTAKCFMDEVLESLTSLAVNFRNLKISPLESKCWKEKWSLELRDEDCNWFKEGKTKQNCDMKFIEATAQLVTVALRENVIAISGIDVKGRKLIRHSGYRFTNKSVVPQNVYIAGFQNGSIYSTAYNLDFKVSTLAYKNVNQGFISSNFNLNTENPVVSCVAQCKKNNDELIVGLCESTTLYRCNFEGKGLWSFQVKVKDFQPPVSLNSTKEDNVLLCDGVSKAISVSSEGNLVCQFTGRNLSDQPLVISEDRSGFVYVLWRSKDETGRRLSSDKVSNNEAAEGEAGVNSSIVVRQYSASGTFISEFIVENTVTMMTTLVDDDDHVVLGVGTPEGLIQCYCMTPFGKMWSNFIHENDAE